ncbi:MAG TPA: hypothetical protein VNW68_02560, partial [Candidatus Limnocylindria bacterium]|nr:hypothetical protein [Candidatus Limnocylindria bacterium]
LKGVPRAVVDAILAERVGSATGEGPDRAAGLRLLERRRSALEREADPARRRQRAYALLARNGFDPETCRVASQRFVAGEAAD